MNPLIRISTALSLGLALGLQPIQLFAALAPQPAATASDAVEIARGGGRGGGRVGGGGGGLGGGGGGGTRRSSGARTGFASFSGGGQVRRPQSVERPSLRVEPGQANRGSRVETRQGNRTDRVNDRNSTRRQAINTWDRNRPAWVNNNWAYNRPWHYGWYGGSYWNNWGWWPGRAAAWGIGTLASFAVIDSLVDSAVDNETSYIEVPESSYVLYYSSVQVSGELVSFEASTGDVTLTYQADCRAGTLNGASPQNAAEAQLLNAACQVAFGQ